MMTTVHVVPVNDLIKHEEEGDGCVCGPITEAVFRDDGSNGWVISHNSLDGREAHEIKH
jgi:hypothetical protein